MRLAPKEVLAARLLAARTAADLAQHEVATALGITQPAVCAWEDPGSPNTPRTEYWEPLAKELKVPLEELFFVADDDPSLAAEG